MFDLNSCNSYASKTFHLPQTHRRNKDMRFDFGMPIRLYSFLFHIWLTIWYSERGQRVSLALSVSVRVLVPHRNWHRKRNGKLHNIGNWSLSHVAIVSVFLFLNLDAIHTWPLDALTAINEWAAVFRYSHFCINDSTMNRRILTFSFETTTLAYFHLTHFTSSFAYFGQSSQFSNSQSSQKKMMQNRPRISLFTIVLWSIYFSFATFALFFCHELQDMLQS